MTLSKKFIIKVEQDEEEEAYIVLPPELLESQGWDETTQLVWSVENGSVYLKKANV